MGLLRALALHQDTIMECNSMRPRRDVFKEIERGEWTHIYLGPEMIMHESFGHLLKSERFSRHFRYFAVDEAHLVLEWAKFHAAFLEIEQLRSRFASRVVWLALSGTVEPKLEFPELVKRLGFDLLHTTTLRLPVDHQSIVLAPRFLQYPASDTEFLDFSWAVPLAATKVDDIPVTVIFVETIKQAVNLKAYLTHLLPSTIKEPFRSQVVRSITGMMSAGHNTNTINNIRNGGSTRILVCTDAGALGIDLPQVKQVAVLVEKKSTY
jgi:superfamily II DNA helicase RecQ